MRWRIYFRGYIRRLDDPETLNPLVVGSRACTQFDKMSATDPEVQSLTSHPEIARACEASICGHAATLEVDVAGIVEALQVFASQSARSL
jgi:hypothetical protein